MKTLSKFILFFLIIFGIIKNTNQNTSNKIFTDPADAYDKATEANSLFKCGKDNPSKAKDCTNYGTDSDFLCCYIENGDKKACALVSYTAAGSPENGLRPIYSNTNFKATCSQEFIKISLYLISLICLFLF